MNNPDMNPKGPQRQISGLAQSNRDLGILTLLGIWKSDMLIARGIVLAELGAKKTPLNSSIVLYACFRKGEEAARSMTWPQVAVVAKSLWRETLSCW